MPQPKKARGGFPYLWAVAGFCLVGVLAFVIRWSPGTEAYDRKVREARLATLEEIRKAADEKLAGYRWVDQEKKVVGLPIERAMELTVGDLKNRTVGPSEVQAVSTGSMIVPPYLKSAVPAAPAAETAIEAAPAQEGTEPAPSPAAEATEAGAAVPATETAPAAPEPTAPAAGETPAPAAPTPAAETPAATPEASAPAEAPAAEPAASPSPSAEPTAPEAATPSPTAPTGEGAPEAAQTPSAD